MDGVLDLRIPKTWLLGLSSPAWGGEKTRRTAGAIRAILLQHGVTTLFPLTAQN
ncbi:MAG TPA: hypothetical protein VGK67_24975 [Myxococcales bacterium]|jgi:hypothetical protein